MNTTNGWAESFERKCLFIFYTLESISDESKAIGWNESFVLVPNMGLEILYHFLFESSEIIFERSFGRKIFSHNFVFSLFWFETEN